LTRATVAPSVPPMLARLLAIFLLLLALPSGAQGLGQPLEPEQLKPDRLPTQVQVPAVPLEGPLDPDRYLCGPGDVFELNFWGAQNFKVRATADLEGKAFLSRIGYVSVSGQTLSAVRAMVRKAVSRSFPGLNFELSLVEPRTFLVHVVNNVVHPGPVPAKQVDRLSTVLERAGGISSGASRRRIQIRHRDGSIETGDLVRYLLTGSTADNPFLRDGDVVEVPFEGLTAAIEGGVFRPGTYELIGTKDLDELFALSGGFSATVTHELPITLVQRFSDGRSTRKELPPAPQGKLVPPLALSAGDDVVVPTLTDLQKTVLVTGAIRGANPAAGSADEADGLRRLPFVQGDTVRSLVLRVGGTLPGADLRRCALLHKDGTATDLDLEALLVERVPGADKPIAAGDTLIIPVRRRAVLVEGAVFRPGSLPYNPRFSLDEYIAAAGGPTRLARPLSEAHMISAEGKVIAYREGTQVLPGDTIVVPERDFSRPELVQLALAGLGIILSGAALLLAARK
jgi:protein involved in polysaccharide export with SLBB domain